MNEHWNLCDKGKSAPLVSVMVAYFCVGDPGPQKRAHGHNKRHVDGPKISGKAQRAFGGAEVTLLVAFARQFVASGKAPYTNTVPARTLSSVLDTHRIASLIDFLPRTICSYVKAHWPHRTDRLHHQRSCLRPIEDEQDRMAK
jgi:hypothetical protein